MGQFSNFRKDVRRMLAGKNHRLLYVWMNRTFIALAVYRFERGAFLMMGKAYGALRIPLVPFFNLIQAYTNIDIHYKADVGGGLAILHASIGNVISARATVGEYLTLTGGNVIGIRGDCPPGSFRIGDHCWMGANACIIGPVIIGDRTNIGAMACVVNDFDEGNTVLVGVPAKRVVRQGDTGS